MDLLKDLISANAPVGQQDPVGNFITGGNAAQAQTKANIENVNARYQQELAFRLQKAIQESIGDNGMPDPVKMKHAGQKYGISEQMVNYAVDMMPKVWKGAADVAGSKGTIQAYTPKGEGTLTNTWASQPAGSQKSSATQSSSSAAAVPGSAVQTPDTDTTGFTTPDMQQTASGYGVGGTGASGQDQQATDAGLTQNSSTLEGDQTPEQAAASAQDMANADEADKSFFGQVNAMEPEGMDSSSQSAEPNPLQVSGMTKWTKEAMTRQLQQEGRLNGKATDDDLQAVMDADYGRITASAGNSPTPAMFVDKDGKLDIGAYKRAQSEYDAKIASNTSEFLKTEGGLYGQQFTQGLQKQANSRANQQNARDQGNYARSVRDWKLQNASMEDLQSMGYKGIDKTNMEEARSVEGARDNILGIENQLGHLKIDSHKMSDGEFNGNVVSVFNKIAELDAAKTEGDRGNIENILLQHKDFRSILSRHGTDWKGAALELFTRQSKRGTMAIMDEMVNNAKRYGQVNGAARKFGNKNVWAKHIGDKHVLPSGKEAVWNGSSWGVE